VTSSKASVGKNRAFLEKEKQERSLRLLVLAIVPSLSPSTSPKRHWVKSGRNWGVFRKIKGKKRGKRIYKKNKNKRTLLFLVIWLEVVSSLSSTLSKASLGKKWEEVVAVDVIVGAYLLLVVLGCFLSGLYFGLLLLW
jgi:hypothetical protein